MYSLLAMRGIAKRFPGATEPDGGLRAAVPRRVRF